MTLYMQYTDKHGTTRVQSHQVWDKARFLATRAAECEKEGGRAVEVDSGTYRAVCWPQK